MQFVGPLSAKTNGITTYRDYRCSQKGNFSYTSKFPDFVDILNMKYQENEECNDLAGGKISAAKFLNFSRLIIGLDESS